MAGGDHTGPPFLSTKAARSEERIGWARGLQQEQFAWAELSGPSRFSTIAGDNPVIRVKHSMTDYPEPLPPDSLEIPPSGDE